MLFAANTKYIFGAQAVTLSSLLAVKTNVFLEKPDLLDGVALDGTSSGRGWLERKNAER